MLARMAKVRGGFKVTSTPLIMIGQILLVNVRDVVKAMEMVTVHRDDIVAKADECDPTLIKLEGDAKAKP
ncbi:MAG: hypothetical protein QXK12_07255 [Candidatus Nezhaarchaeales archaeon]